MKSFRLFAVGLFLITLFSGPETSHATRLAAQALRLHNQNPLTATDLHFEAAQKEGWIYVDSFDIKVQGGGFTDSTCTLATDSHSVICDYWGGNVDSCESVVIKATVNLTEANMLFFRNLKWTCNGEEWPAGPHHGWRVRGIVNGVTRFIFYNDDTVATMEVDSLRFYKNGDYISIETLYHTWTDWGPPHGPFPLGPGDSVVISLSGMIPGKFLYMAGKVEYSFPRGTQTEVGTIDFVALHEEQSEEIVPTLTEWGLIIFGVVLIGFITYVFLRRRRAVVSYQ